MIEHAFSFRDAFANTQKHLFNEMEPTLKTVYQQDSYQDSPWTLWDRIKMQVWEAVWFFLCRWTPKPCNRWRTFWLKAFGAKLGQSVFVDQRARIKMPWNLEMGDRSCLGDGAHAYNQDKIVIGAGTIVAQECYLCTGSHDLSLAAKPLVTAPISIGENVFIGARSFILPGLSIGNNAIIGAGSIVTKCVPRNSCVAGNPAKIIENRKSKDSHNHFDG